MLCLSFDTRTAVTKARSIRSISVIFLKVSKCNKLLFCRMITDEKTAECVLYCNGLPSSAYVRLQINPRVPCVLTKDSRVNMTTLTSKNVFPLRWLGQHQNMTFVLSGLKCVPMTTNWTNWSIIWLFTNKELPLTLPQLFQFVNGKTSLLDEMLGICPRITLLIMDRSINLTMIYSICFILLML